MKYKIIILLLFLSSCAQNQNTFNLKPAFTSKGLALIYNEFHFDNKVINRKLDDSSFQIAHNKIKTGSLIKIINPYTNESIILKNSKKVKYPQFYKLLITKPVAEKINLNLELPFIEIIEVKKNKSFIAKKTKIYKEEKKIFSNAPIESVKINNISKISKQAKLIKEKNIYIVIAEFYSKKSALILKKRIINDLSNFNSKKLVIKSKNINKITLLSGPYRSINSMKNDYIHLNNFGFEELDISINE
jgi:hypothetical protein